jgi:ABC-type branched-subunit amino acid transport system substrate-binding protein
LGLLAIPLLMDSASALLAPLAAASKKSPNRPRAAILAPLTGTSASIGVSIQRAAMLAQSPATKAEDLMILDTGGTAAGAAAAAAQAVKGGARIIIGPLFAEESRAAARAAGVVPVLSLSNDEDLIGSGAFLLGITASQSVAATLAYARSRGVRRIAVLGGESRWSIQGSAIAIRMSGTGGLDVRALPAGTTPANLMVALRKAGGGELPDALLITEGGDALRMAARATAASGLQLLGTQQSLELRAEDISGAWLSGPDPAALSELANRFSRSGASAPGLIAALANDAMTIVETLRNSGVVDRSALLAGQGFEGITGPIRFSADGSASRDMPVLVAGANGYIRTDRISGQ